MDHLDIEMEGAWMKNKVKIVYFVCSIYKTIAHYSITLDEV